MKAGAATAFGAQLKVLREAAGFTQEELATIAGLSVHAVSALERGERRRPQFETVRALSTALDLTGPIREALVASARPRARTGDAAADERRGVSLPLGLTALLGRDADLQTLRRWLADPVARLTTLTGPGGAGKTRLAVEIARAIAVEETVRVLFVELAAIRDAAFVAQAIAEAFNVPDAAPLDLPKRIGAACDGGPTLLILDNFEQVLDAAPLIADLLAAVAALRVLVTSRAPLRLRGEREFAVGPLALQVDSDATSPAEVGRSPAVQLFVDRARDVQPEFRLTPANGSTVMAICRRLDALPLAIELAARWIKVLTPEDLHRRLDHDVLLTTIGPLDLPERQQTMNATVAWSYQLLGPSEQRVFRRLGALPGRFPIEAAAAVVAGRKRTCARSDEVLGAAAGLMDKSLLQRADYSAPTRPLYQMFDTVRAYAALELTASGERDDALEGLAGYCLGQASLAAEGLVGAEQAEWLDRVREDLESYRAALSWLLDRGRPAEASTIAWSLFFFWAIRGHAAEGLRWYEQILTQPRLPSGVETRALLGTAAMRYTQGELRHARTAVTRALALARAGGDTVLIARAENLLGDIEHSSGHADAAREHFTRSVEAFRGLAIPWGLGNSLTGLATVLLATGEPEHAERLLDEATSVLRHAAPWFLSWTLHLRAFLAVRRGDADQAIAFVRESLTHIRQLHDTFALVSALVPLAAAAVLKGDDKWAARILGAGDAVTERTGAAVVDKLVAELKNNTERQVAVRLGAAGWAGAYAAGRSTSIDSLLKDIERVRTARVRP